MLIKINGQDFQGFTTAQVTRHFLNAAGQFSFVSTPKDLTQEDYPIKLGDTCEIIIENETFLTGFIETVSIDRGDGLSEFNINVSGRDITGDLIDSTIDWNIITEFSGNITLKQICEKIIKRLNIDGLGVVDNVDPKPFPNGTFIAPHAGQSAFNFLQQYSRLANTILSTDGNSNLTINQTGTFKVPTNLLLEVNGKKNNILTTSSQITTANQYNKYASYSQVSLQTFNTQNTKLAKDSGNLQDLSTNQHGVSTNNKIREGRNYVFIADTPFTSTNNANDYAKWENNYRKSQGFKYQVSFATHTYDGTNIWQPNTLVKVKDDFSNIDAILLIDTVSFTEDLNQGKVTHLNLVWQNAYSLLIEQNFREAKANVIQSGYASVF